MNLKLTMRSSQFAFLALGMLYADFCWAARCATDTRAYAEQLLKLHTDSDRKIQIESNVKSLSPVKSPRSKLKREREEVWGNSDSARYRMRFSYFKSVDECVLVEQEIFEFSDGPQ